MASNEKCTLFVGNLSERVTEDLVFELFLQAGPVESVRIPTQNGRRRTFGFVEFKHEISVPYATRLFQHTSLYGRTLNLRYKYPNDRIPQMHDSFTNVYPQPYMSRLNPPIREDKHPNPKSLLSRETHKKDYFTQKRIPSHLMPSPAKKRIHEDIGKKQIPDQLDYSSLLNSKSSKDTTKKKCEKSVEDLRSMIKMKKKKKKKDKKLSSRERASSEEKSTSKGGFLHDQPPKSYIRNAVNQLKQHCSSRYNRGSYDFNIKHKRSSHVHFDT